MPTKKSDFYEHGELLIYLVMVINKFVCPSQYEHYRGSARKNEDSLSHQSLDQLANYTQELIILLNNFTKKLKENFN